jgi:hypothetical protein
MTADGLSLAATIILILPMMYCFVATPTFLLRPLSDPVVTWLLRGVFNVGFWLVDLFGAASAVAFLAAGRPPVTVALGLLASLAVLVRHWLLRRMDADLGARDAGDPKAVRRLRRLHWGGMAYNAAQLAAVVANISAAFAQRA